MFPYNKVKKFGILSLVLMAGCTKLDEGLESTLTYQQAATLPTSLLLQAAYVDVGAPFTGQDQIFSLQENTTDESLVPTRGGDWDDNGVWRVLHNHTWNADHGQVLSVFNNLNKLSFDATNVLAFNPSAGQAAEAKFLRAFALYHLLDLYNQYPLRDPGENLLKAPQVKTGADAINFIISELNAALPNLGNSGPATVTADACRALLMRCYLNKGAFINRAAPTFDPADMQQVITLGNAVIGSARYSYTTNYFDNFSVDNSIKSKEAIFAYPNQSGVSANNSGPQARWNMTLHYNSYGHPGQSIYGNAGWNGFSTISDFYNSFSIAGAPAITNSPTDTSLDKRLGGRVYAGVTNYSGIRPGFLVGQQFDEKGVARVDRKNNPLSFTPTIAANMIETGNNLEITGIRVVKYAPDFSDTTGKFYGGPAGNWIMLLRYPDVVLMVVEAKMRSNTDLPGALTSLNALRTARGAATFAALPPLVNTGNVDDANTLLAERGRELYWESVRRTDLIRFGVYLKPWGLKPSDDPKYLLFPVPNQALAANPNLKQNTGY